MLKYLLLTAALLGGCAQTKDAPASLSNPFIVPLKSSNIRIHWIDESEINDKCRSVGVQEGARIAACAVVHYKPETSSSVCDLYAVQPQSFLDSRQLAYLGHEAWHCLGASHDEINARGLKRTKERVEQNNLQAQAKNSSASQ